MQCKKCGDKFPFLVTIDGKKRNLCNRKFCLNCSPFGSHNTKALNLTHEQQKTLSPYKVRSCGLCAKELVRKSERGKLCWTCTNRKARQDKIKRIIQIVGDSCWFCGYSRCWRAIHFHHVNPDEKIFGLSNRELQYSWKKINVEIKKCVLACACCHMEIHDGIILEKDVKAVWMEKWKLHRDTYT